MRRSCGWCFFQAEDGIRDLVRSRGLGDVYKRQAWTSVADARAFFESPRLVKIRQEAGVKAPEFIYLCLLYTSDAADERSSVDLGGRRIIKKKKTVKWVRT